MSALYAGKIRDVDLSVPGPEADHNGTSKLMGALGHVMRVRKPRRVYTVSGCTQTIAISAILAVIELAHIEAYEPSCSDVKFLCGPMIG